MLLATCRRDWATQARQRLAAVGAADLSVLTGGVPAFAAAGAGVRHVKVVDGPGRPLGRSFRVKLWPSVIVMRDGVELARVVRPASQKEIERALTSS